MVLPKKIPFFKNVWAASYFIIIWTVLKERNLRIFGSSNTSAKNLQDLILLRLCWWITGWNDGFPYSPLDIQRNPTCLLWKGKPSHENALTHSIPPEVWSPAEINCLKWNVDASVHIENSCSAIGGVLRNHLRNFICLCMGITQVH